MKNAALETLLWQEQDNILTPALIAEILRLASAERDAPPSRVADTNSRFTQEVWEDEATNTSFQPH